MEYFEYLQAVEDRYIVVGELIPTIDGLFMVEEVYINPDCSPDGVVGVSGEYVEGGSTGGKVYVEHGEILTYG